jgi:hypothetical protein
MIGVCDRAIPKTAWACPVASASMVALASVSEVSSASASWVFSSARLASG